MVRCPDARRRGDQLTHDPRHGCGVSTDSVRQRIRESAACGSRGAWRSDWIPWRPVVWCKSAREVVEAADGARARPRQHRLSAEKPVSADRDRLTRLELHLGRLLVTGVATSAILLAIGLTLWLSDPLSSS